MHQAHPPSTEGPSFEIEGYPPQRDRLRSMTFIGLLLTQFLGATNDNILRWLVIGIGKEYVDKLHISTVLAVGSGCLVLPYLLLAAPAGYLADRFSKRDVIIRCKVAEIAIMALAIGAILVGNVYFHVCRGGADWVVRRRCSGRRNWAAFRRCCGRTRFHRQTA